MRHEAYVPSRSFSLLVPALVVVELVRVEWAGVEWAGPARNMALRTIKLERWVSVLSHRPSVCLLDSAKIHSSAVPSMLLRK